MTSTLTKQQKKRRMRLLGAVLICAALIAPGLYNKLYIRHYTLEADEITSPIRIALITDLHSCKYGEQESELLDAIDAQHPDVILLGGDIFDDEKDDLNTEAFLQGISGKYPAYYVTGNHEYWSGNAFDQKMATLDKYHIPRLSGTSDDLKIGTQTITICGIDDQSDADSEKQFAAIRSQQHTHYTILLSHRPELWEDYLTTNADLILCGHAHGGQWRIPGILNGLYAPDQGLFPKYAGGMYQEDSHTMIVSRGLARETTIVPRLYNRPELVIIDIA